MGAIKKKNKKLCVTNQLNMQNKAWNSTLSSMLDVWNVIHSSL